MISNEQLEAFCKAVDVKIMAHYSKNAEGHKQDNESGEDYARRVHGVKPLEIQSGKKYARIVSPGSGVFCFVDLANGNILKAAGWKAPAKHARGNIANGANDVGPYGPAYMR